VAAGHLRRSDLGVRFRERFRFCATLPGVAAYKPTGTASGSYHPIPPASGSVPVQEQGVRPSRRLAYRFDVDFDAGSKTLSLGVKNRGRLGIHLQARSLTVAGAPYSYTIGAADELAIALANPGT
jgi:phospholipase C